MDDLADLAAAYMDADARMEALQAEWRRTWDALVAALRAAGHKDLHAVDSISRTSYGSYEVEYHPHENHSRPAERITIMPHSTTEGD